MLKFFKKLLIGGFISLGLIVAFTYYCNQKIVKSTQDKIYSDISEIPYNHTGILLGTSKYLQSGYVNLYYAYRIEAAAQLMKAGKIKYLVISGDNSRKDYSEPEDMRNDLILAGIDSNHIFLDYAGFRTFDSMVRLREIFSQKSTTVISQKFHVERAIYIGEQEGIASIGYPARDVTQYYGFRTQVREVFARVKVFVDALVNTQPKFLGPKVTIPE